MFWCPRLPNPVHVRRPPVAVALFAAGRSPQAQVEWVASRGCPAAGARLERHAGLLAGRRRRGRRRVRGEGLVGQERHELRVWSARGHTVIVSAMTHGHVGPSNAST